jgi:MFS family permease
MSASVGRFIQGAGGAFSMIGAAYIAGTYFPASRAAGLLGATQMFGMAGGAAGQFLVGPAIAGGLPWNRFWILMALAGLVMAALLYLFTPPKQEAPATTSTPERSEWVKTAAAAIAAVFGNPQSILCGLIAGLLFLPTTIFDMLWGVRFLQESHDVEYSVAVLRSASVPFGWIIGSPLLGLLSDRIGRRKPVIIGSAFVPAHQLHSYSLRSTGPLPRLQSGPDCRHGFRRRHASLHGHQGSQSPRAQRNGYWRHQFHQLRSFRLLGPVFGILLTHVSSGGERELVHYQTAFAPLGYGVALAIVLTLILRETGPAARTARRPPESTPEPHTKGRPAASH